MKRSLILNILATILILIMVIKLIYWLVSDIPIYKGSMLILALFVTLLFVKNRYTYFLLLGLILFCFAYKFINHNWSGYLAVDFLSSIHRPMESTSAVLIYIPYVFYFLLLLILFLPRMRKTYFKTH